MALLKKVLTSLAAAVFLSYASLLVPDQVTMMCGNVGEGPMYCPMLAYGLPLPYLVDSPDFSPLGSVDRLPWFFLSPIDVILWPRLALSLLFWLGVVVLAQLAWGVWRRRH